MAAALLGRLLLRRGPRGGTGFVSDEEPVIIAGMHRSGTSVMTNLLKQAGLYLGGVNVDEHDESLHFSQANRAMLGEAAAQLYELGWAAPKTQEFIEARRGYAEQAARQLSKFFAGRKSETVWGWKDPRNSLTLGVWLSIFPHARVLHILRDGRTVALSLADRDALAPSYSVALWAHYVAEAERVMEQLPDDRRLTVRYEDFVQRPGDVMADVLRFARVTGTIDASALASIDPGTAAAREADARITSIGPHPLLERYGYGLSADAET